MAVNCAALPETLLESELFGHEKGSFTGADRRRIGKFEQCNGGTLFLDEVGDMAPIVQGKVLRLLQEQRFERVGGNETIETDVRLIAATNRPLEEMVERNEFRADLLYRLNGVSISLPPLRERPQDIPALLQHFLSKFRGELQKVDIEGLAPETLDILKAYHWPGNVRELQSVVRQMVLNASGPVIVPEFLPEEVRTTDGGKSASRDQSASESGGLPPADLQRFIETRIRQNSTNLYAETVEMMERYLFTRVLQVTEGNQTRASELLGITRGKIRDRIAAFDISMGKQITIGDHATEPAADGQPAAAATGS
jgi:two-component system nitrogen regulation response regulator GlnG